MQNNQRKTAAIHNAGAELGQNAARIYASQGKSQGHFESKYTILTSYQDDIFDDQWMRQQRVDMVSRNGWFVHEIAHFAHI